MGRAKKTGLTCQSGSTQKDGPCPAPGPVAHVQTTSYQRVVKMTPKTHSIPTGFRPHLSDSPP